MVLFAWAMTAACEPKAPADGLPSPTPVIVAFSVVDRISCLKTVPVLQAFSGQLTTAQRTYAAADTAGRRQTLADLYVDTARAEVLLNVRLAASADESDVSKALKTDKGYLDAMLDGMETILAWGDVAATDEATRVAHFGFSSDVLKACTGSQPTASPTALPTASPTADPETQAASCRPIVAAFEERANKTRRAASDLNSGDVNVRRFGALEYLRAMIENKVKLEQALQTPMSTQVQQAVHDDLSDLDAGQTTLSALLAAGHAGDSAYQTQMRNAGAHASKAWLTCSFGKAS